jgi:DNA polymerase III epsilon subunit-like protein
MKEIDLIVWDLETSGFIAPDAKILEIGAFIVRGDEIEKRNWVLNNKIQIPANIIEITGITQEIVDAGRDPKECLDEFLPLLKEAKTHVTHNGFKFDIPFLVDTVRDIYSTTKEESDQFWTDLLARAFDTAVHFKAKRLRIFKKPGETFTDFAQRVMEIRAYGIRYNLTTCAEEMKIDLAGIVAHRAMADVEITHKLFTLIWNTK